jgi:hypothetical protein
MTVKRATNVWVVVALVAWVAMIVLFWKSVAQGQAASQPASQPAVVASAGWAWVKANLWWLLPLGINLLSSIATALKNYPKADGVAKVIWLIVAFLGNVEFKDGKRPGFVLKAPCMMPALPPGGPRPAADADAPAPVPAADAKPADAPRADAPADKSADADKPKD